MFVPDPEASTEKTLLFLRIAVMPPALEVELNGGGSKREADETERGGVTEWVAPPLIFNCGSGCFDFIFPKVFGGAGGGLFQKPPSHLA